MTSRWREYDLELGKMAVIAASATAFIDALIKMGDIRAAFIPVGQALVDRYRDSDRRIQELLTQQEKQ